jgi:alanine racemase
LRPVRAEIDLGAIRHNVALLAELVAPAVVCAVVKADGYGHGAVPVARAALAGGATGLAVALAGEGAELRAAGIDASVMLLSQASAAEVDELVVNRLDATVYSAAGLDLLVAAARRAGRNAADPVAVHVKVDSGMRRVGAEPADVAALVHGLLDQPALRLASVFTHQAVADEPDHPFTTEQLNRFAAVRHDLATAGVDVPMVHAANTAAAIDRPDARLDLVRCGIGIYGIDPAPALAGRVAFRPALSLHAEVSFVKRVGPGEGLSYGLRHTTDRQTTIATLPLGYADGVPRRFGATGGEVLIGGHRLPVVGSVTMDQLLVDCGDQPVAAGDEAVLIGEQGGERITAQDWADRLGIIAYEVVCGISSRVPRRFLEDPA